MANEKCENVPSGADKIPCSFCHALTKKNYPKCYECYQMEKQKGDYRMPVGKYKGFKFDYIVRDTLYIQWLIDCAERKGAYERLINYYNNLAV